MYMPHIKFQDSSISGSRVSQLPSITDRQTDRRTDGQTDRRTDGRTDRPKPICPLNFFEVGGIIIAGDCWGIAGLLLEYWILLDYDCIIGTCWTIAGILEFAGVLLEYWNLLKYWNLLEYWNWLELA